MKKRGTKLVNARARTRARTKKVSRAVHAVQMEEDTLSLDSAEGGATSKDTLLRRDQMDPECDPEYDVYEADSENEDEDELDEDEDGYLFVDPRRERTSSDDVVLDLQRSVLDNDDEEGEEGFNDQDDMKKCVRIHEETGKMYTRISDSDKNADNNEEYPDRVMLQYILDQKVKPLAPALNDNLQYHAFFLCHQNDLDWTMKVVEKLQTPGLGFQCSHLDTELDQCGSIQNKVHLGIKNAQKTVFVLSPDFVAFIWSHSDLELLSEMDVLLIEKDLVLILLQDCDIPSVLSGVVCIDVSEDDWFGKLLALLISSEDTPVTEETALSMSSSLVGLNPNLQSGNLLHSTKSRCVCCGKEVIDATQIPDELLAHGVQVPPDQYKEAIQYLMSDDKFRCHVWCYNTPAAILFFLVLLALCLVLVPLVERRLVHTPTHAGLEFVHGGIVWICVLTIYMAVIHIAKRRMKGSTYKRLTYVNTILIKYNLLAGVENLGLADCNKYYLHFFYFEIGPCLAYLQELMLNIDEYTTCFNNQIAESGDVTIDMSCDHSVSNSNDATMVLNNTEMTNTSIQTQAEDLILQHSGEYISLLITKRLTRPHRQRHVREYPCLCQFVEQRVYKMIV